MCPDEPIGPVVRLSFRGHTGRVLAKAAQAAGDEVGNCSLMFFSVEGREQKPLARRARDRDRQPDAGLQGAAVAGWARRSVSAGQEAHSSRPNAPQVARSKLAGRSPERWPRG